MQPRRMTAVAAAAGAALLSSAVFADPYPVKGQLVQVLEAFDNPEGAIFSADGRFVFVSNAAELGMPDKGFHWTEKAGYISKLAVQPDGTLKMVNEKLVTGITAPLGMAVSPVATAKFPKGSIFLCAGRSAARRSQRHAYRRRLAHGPQAPGVQRGRQGSG